MRDLSGISRLAANRRWICRLGAFPARFKGLKKRRSPDTCAVASATCATCATCEQKMKMEQVGRIMAECQGEAEFEGFVPIVTDVSLP